MVKISKELTHIYHNQLASGLINIGDAESRADEITTLFDKSLVLTSDLKRLPYLLGGKLFVWYDSHILISMTASTVVGVGFTVVLLNGTYEIADYVNFADLMGNTRAVDDILLVLHGSFHTIASTQAGNVVNVPISHWDFEGQKILYDSITLMVFLDADANVATATFSGSNIKVNYELEIDWRPLNKAELMEFLMEHIYAKQGD